MSIAYYPVMQISRPNDSRGIPPGRWLYPEKLHALAVLYEFWTREKKRQLDWDIRNKKKTPKSKQYKAWLLVAEVPIGLTLSATLKSNDFNDPVNGGRNKLPAFYTKEHWSKVLEIIAVDTEDDDWTAVRVQRAMEKSADF